MKAIYDFEVDSLYLKLGEESPEGVTEISEGINLDMTSDGRLIGIEIIEASKKMNMRTILSYGIELDKNIFGQKTV